MSASVQLHIIYLRSGRVLLSKKEYSSWREIQDEYEDYMTSLGPWSAEDVLGFLREEYPRAPFFSAEQVDALVNGDDVTLE